MINIIMKISIVLVMVCITVIVAYSDKLDKFIESLISWFYNKIPVIIGVLFVVLIVLLLVRMWGIVL